MIQRFVEQFPVWMRSEHPILRPLINRDPQNDTFTVRLSRGMFTVFLIGIVILVNYLIISDGLKSNPFALPLTQLLIRLIWGPIFVLQALLQIGLVIIAISMIGELKQRQTFDDIRSTTGGVDLLIKTRWSYLVFYRIRGLWAIVIGSRGILISGLLYDLTAFRGEYLRNLMGSIIPQLPPEMGVVLLAFTIASSLLLPFTSLGVDVAIGLLVSTFVNQRTYTVLVQGLLGVWKLVVLALLLFGVNAFNSGELHLSQPLIWLLLLLFAVIGDWGLSFLYLGFVGSQVWASIPYGILMGVAMLVIAIIQSILVDKVLTLAARRADN